MLRLRPEHVQMFGDFFRIKTCLSILQLIRRGSERRLHKQRQKQVRWNQIKRTDSLSNS